MKRELDPDSCSFVPRRSGTSAPSPHSARTNDHWRRVLQNDGLNDKAYGVLCFDYPDLDSAPPDSAVLLHEGDILQR